MIRKGADNQPPFPGLPHYDFNKAVLPRINGKGFSRRNAAAVYGYPAYAFLYPARIGNMDVVLAAPVSWDRVSREFPRLASVRWFTSQV